MQSKVYQKGQIVIPVELRKKYGIEIGGTVNIIQEKKYLKIVPLKKKESILDIAGCFKSKKPFLKKQEIDKLSSQSYIKDHKRD
ncbi:MAG: AbrB/MazE/SpoVT family DNA-binding domain-containing protein [Candidatus Scalindua sp.]